MQQRAREVMRRVVRVDEEGEVSLLVQQAWHGGIPGSVGTAMRGRRHAVLLDEWRRLGRVEKPDISCEKPASLAASRSSRQKKGQERQRPLDLVGEPAAFASRRKCAGSPTRPAVFSGEGILTCLELNKTGWGRTNLEVSLLQCVKLTAFRPALTA